jgi:dipeptidyl aminopeptidase/acylaminoacyl peptidase
MKSTIAMVLVLLAFLPSGARSLQSTPCATGSWCVPGNPAVTSQEIQFSNAGVNLAGTVYLPAAGDHLPAVVVLHHAGAATRAAALYRHLREGLPAMGFAVLIYDRRGSGESSGNLQSADYETLADDAIAGQHALAKLPRIDPAKIGFWGLSQGGWLAVLASGRSPDAAFAISISAPLVNADQQMRFATSNLLSLRGYSRDDVKEMLETRSAWMGYLHGTTPRTAAVDALTRAQSRPWFGFTYMPSAAQLSDNPALRRKMDDDPAAAVAKTKVPLLFIYGGSDPWVPVAESIERLEKLRAQRPGQAIDCFTIAGASHEMMLPAKETMDTDPNSAPQAPAYFMVLGAWLSRRFPSR